MWPGVATRLRAGWSGFRIPVVVSEFSRHQNFQTRYGTHLDSYSVATGVLFPRNSGLGVNGTTRLHPMPRLSMSGAVRLLPLYAFGRGQGKLCPFTFFAGYCYLSLRLVPRDEHMQPARFEGVCGILAPPYTSLPGTVYADARDFSRPRSIQTGCGVHSASYSEGAMSLYTVAKASEEWSWPFSLIWYGRSEFLELYLHPPICLHGMHTENFTFTLPLDLRMLFCSFSTYTRVMQFIFDGNCVFSRDAWTSSSWAGRRCVLSVADQRRAV